MPSPEKRQPRGSQHTPGRDDAGHKPMSDDPNRTIGGQDSPRPQGPRKRDPMTTPGRQAAEAKLYRVVVEGGGRFLYDAIDAGRLMIQMAEQGDTRTVSVALAEQPREEEPLDLTLTPADRDRISAAVAPFDQARQSATGKRGEQPRGEEERLRLRRALRPFDGCWSWGPDVGSDEVLALEDAARAALNAEENPNA